MFQLIGARRQRGKSVEGARPPMLREQRAKEVTALLVRSDVETAIGVLERGRSILPDAQCPFPSRKNLIAFNALGLLVVERLALGAECA